MVRADSRRGIVRVREKVGVDAVDKLKILVMKDSLCWVPFCRGYERERGRVAWSSR